MIAWRGLLDNNKKQNKHKTKNKHSLTDCILQFFSFSWHGKVILFDEELLVQKARRGHITLNEVLNNCGLLNINSIARIV